MPYTVPLAEKIVRTKTDIYNLKRALEAAKADGYQPDLVDENELEALRTEMLHFLLFSGRLLGRI